MDRKQKGNIGEAKALLYFIENGYNVFMPFQDNGKYDMIVEKDNILSKVSVKATSQEDGPGYLVELRNVSRRKDNKVNIGYFDNASIDLLAVYICPLDKVVILNTKDIKGKSSCYVAEKHLKV